MRSKLLFLVIVIFMLSVSIAYSQQAAQSNPCGKEIQEQNKALDPSNRLVMKKSLGSSSAYYETKGKLTKFYERGGQLELTKIPDKMAEPAFDAVIPRSNGELELFKADHGAKKCRSLGFVKGVVQKDPITFYGFYVSGSNANLRLFDGNQEMTFFRNDNSKMSLFVMYKPDMKGYTIAINNPGAKIAFAQTSSPGIFKDGIKNLPSDNEYYKVGCTSTEKGSKGEAKEVDSRIIFYYFPSVFGHAIAVPEKCRVTKETSSTLRSPSSKRDASYDMEIRSKGYTSFFLKTYPKMEKDGWLYKVQFWGKNAVDVDGVSILKGSEQPYIAVVKDEEEAKGGKGEPDLIRAEDMDGRTIVMGQERILRSKGELNIKVTGDYNEKYQLSSGKQLFVFGSDGKRMITVNEGKLKIYRDGGSVGSTADCSKHGSLQASGKKFYISACYIFDEIDFIGSEKKLVLPEDESEYDIALFGYDSETFNIESRLLNKGAIKSVSGYEKYLNNKRVKIMNSPQYPKGIILKDNSETEMMPYNAKWGRGAIGELKFSALVYNKLDYRVRRLECDGAKGTCLLDGQKVYAPRSSIKCSSDGECGENRVCKDNVCVRSEGRCIRHERGKDGWIDVHVYGFGMTDEEVDKTLDSWLNTFFSISPFKENERLFDIKYKSLKKPIDTIIDATEKLDDMYAMSIIGSKCQGDADIVLLLTKDMFRAAAWNNRIYMPLRSEGKPDMGLVFAHEFGHAFGGLTDEYCEGKDGKCGSSGPVTNLGINCNFEDNIKSVWPSIDKTLLDTAKNKKWTSCGCSSEECDEPLIPSANSMMNREQQSPNVFNTVSYYRLSKRLLKREPAISYSDEFVAKTK
ncbi:MAG: hypothetical protein V1906_03415 [Candidatus Woesearchaeota archaeon]